MAGCSMPITSNQCTSTSRLAPLAYSRSAPLIAKGARLDGVRGTPSALPMPTAWIADEAVRRCRNCWYAVLSPEKLVRTTVSVG